MKTMNSYPNDARPLWQSVATQRTGSGVLFVLLLATLSSCGLFGKKDDPDPAPQAPAYQTAIDAKFKALGWNTDGHAPFNNTGPVKTASGKGYVQYYAFGSNKSAIYYSPDKGAFGMNTVQMNTYEAAGQDNFAVVVSDPKSCGTGCEYNDFLIGTDNEGVVVLDKLVYGEIYKKYKTLNRWEGVLGVPTTSELNLTSGKGRYNGFKGGQIYWAPSTGSQAFWGKVEKLYATTGYDTGWLGLPTDSCDPSKKDANQSVGFQNGRIGVGSNGTCGNYYDKTGLSVLNTGKRPTSGNPPCY